MHFFIKVVSRISYRFFGIKMQYNFKVCRKCKKYVHKAFSFLATLLIQ